LNFWLIYKQDTQYRTNVRICSILEIVEMIAARSSVMVNI